MYVVKPWMLAVAVLAALGVTVLLWGILTPPAQEPAVVPSSPQTSVAVPDPQIQPAPVVTMEAAEPEPAPVEPTAVPEVVPTIAADGYIAPSEYDHVTDAAGFQIHWSSDRTTLRIGLVSPGTGYVAIGFDPESRMEGANYILGAVRHDGVVVRDDFGTGPMSHAADTSLGGTEDILAYGGHEEGGRTILEFVLPLDSGDATDKPLVPGLTYRILVAYHATDDNFSAKHTRRGAGEIRLDRVP